MRSLVFEGKTWLIYEELREKDKKLHKILCKLLIVDLYPGFEHVKMLGLINKESYNPYKLFFLHKMLSYKTNY